jgi:hypothetical protein
MSRLHLASALANATASLYAQSRAKLELEDAQSEKLNHQLPRVYLLLVEGETLNPPARRAARGGVGRVLSEIAARLGRSCSPTEPISV